MIKYNNVSNTLVMVVLTITNVYSQYFSKTYRISGNVEKESFFSYSWPTSENKIIALNRFVCPNNQGCIGFKNFESTGIENFELIKEYIQGNRHCMKLRNDTIFYSGRSFSTTDSIFYWYFGMTTLDGDSIAEFKYSMLHLKNGNVTNYGLVLTGGSEAILWGEGLDTRHPNPNNIPYRSVFFRVGFEGEIKSDLIWYDRNNHPTRRIFDAETDVDGNPIFAYMALDEKLRRYILKLTPEDSIKTIGFIDIYNSSLDFPTMTVDNLGSYYLNSNHTGRDSIWNEDKRYTTHVTKMNREGDILWSTMMPHISKKNGWSYLEDFEMLRMTVSANNDILCAGMVEISDTFYHPNTNEPFPWVVFASFIARLSPEGEVKWRHILAPKKSDGLFLESIIFDIREALDGSIIVGGNLQRDTTGYITDAWLMRLSPEGCLNDKCNHLEKYWFFPDTISLTETIQLHPMLLYPNPGQQGFRISPSSEMTYPLQYELINSSGIRLQTGFSGNPDDDVDTSWLHTGVYQVLVRDRNGKVFSGRWLKI